VAVCDFLDAAVNFPGRLNIPSVLFQHNVESEIWRRHAETAGNPVKKMMYRMEFRKMLRYERSAVRKFQHVIAVSENDRALMMQWVDGDRITVVPTGVDLAQYTPGPERGEWQCAATRAARHLCRCHGLGAECGRGGIFLQRSLAGDQG
jgi:polysaccharide biosynthesis protein PslH